MKRLLFLLLLSSCQTAEDRNVAHIDSVIADLKGRTEELHHKKIVDSLSKSILHDAYMDTVGLSTSPVRILKSKMIKATYSNARNIYLSYKNISSKKIDAMKLMWYGVDAFGEPANMGSASLLSPGMGGGMTDDPLSPGKIANNTWEILSEDGKSVILAWPREVVFSDGTKWRCGK